MKLALVGQLSLADKAHLDGVLEHYDDLLGALEEWERHTDLVVLPTIGTSISFSSRASPRTRSTS